MHRSPSSTSLSTMGSSMSSAVSSSMSRAFKKLNSGFTASPGHQLAGLVPAGLAPELHATADECLLAEEFGDWQYLVIDPGGIRSRQDASYTKATKRADLSRRYGEGSVVPIDRRRKAGWTRWLGIKGGDGWLFDVSPKDKKVRMVEAEVVSGPWMYECLVERVPIVKGPLLSLAAKPPKTGPALTLGEQVEVLERVRPLGGKGSFLQLSDGRGWMLDYRDGQQVLQRKSTTVVGEVVVDSVESTGPDGCVSSEAVKTAGLSFEPLASSAATTSFLPSNHLSAPERGEWEYIVVDKKGLSLRSEPTYDPSHKTRKRLEEGEVAVVVERIAGDGTTFLRVASPPGWCFDRQPGAAARLRMMEIQVEKGLWYYTVLAERGVGLRARCSFSELAKVGQGPLKGNLCEVSQRVQVGETTFLKIEGGWIFDRKHGKAILDGPVDVVHMPPESLAEVLDVADADGVRLRSMPTEEAWAHTRFLVLLNSKVLVTMVCKIQWVRWAKVSKGTMEGWLPSSCLKLLQEPQVELMADGRPAAPPPYDTMLALKGPASASRRISSQDGSRSSIVRGSWLQQPPSSGAVARSSASAWADTDAD